MSTQQIDRWEKLQQVLEKANGNFSTLEEMITTGLAGKADITVGVYTGDGALTRVIPLGFRPTAVLVVDQKGTMGYGQASRGGLALDGYPAKLLESTLVGIVDNGFQVGRGDQTGSTYYADTNNANLNYRYVTIQI